jgi:hypothetical protein
LKNVKVPEEEMPGILPEQPVEETPLEPLPDWLQGIEAVAAIPTEPLGPAKEPAEELPARMQETELPSPEKAGEKAEEGLPEWLQGLESTPETGVIPAPAEPVAVETVPAVEWPQEQPAEIEPLAEMPVEEAGQAVELPQEQLLEVWPSVEAPIEEAVSVHWVPEEQPLEIIPAEETLPVVEELHQAVASLEQPEITEEISQPVVTPAPEEFPAEVVPVIAGVDITQVFSEAQDDLHAGNLDQALPKYLELIESQAYIEEIIRDLQNALYRHPVDVALHETLGDAYAQSNRLQDALDTYTKAEELLLK